MSKKCPYCSAELPDDSEFCNRCGKKYVTAEELLLLQNNGADKPLTMGEKIKIYSFSLVLAPFGLYWFFKYFRSTEPTKKSAAYAALIITVITLTLSGFVVSSYVKAVRNYEQIYKANMGMYEDLGY